MEQHKNRARVVLSMKSGAIDVEKEKVKLTECTANILWIMNTLYPRGTNITVLELRQLRTNAENNLSAAAALRRQVQAAGNHNQQNRGGGTIPVRDLQDHRLT
jgi:hypothetical protein